MRERADTRVRPYRLAVERAAKRAQTRLSVLLGGDGPRGDATDGPGQRSFTCSGMRESGGRAMRIGYARQRAGGGEAMTVARHPAVAGTEQVDHAGKTRGESKRPSPPHLAGEKDECVGAAVERVVRSEHAHFTEQFFFAEGQTLPHPGGLKRGEMISARPHETRQAPDTSPRSESTFCGIV